MADAMKVKMDSVPKGSTDVRAILRDVDGDVLREQIASGAHDGILSELLELEAGHATRDSVVIACRARRKVAK